MEGFPSVREETVRFNDLDEIDFRSPLLVGETVSIGLRRLKDRAGAGTSAP